MIDPADLSNEPDSNRTSKKGEMRRLYPAIHQKLTDGKWTAFEMVDWLARRGIQMSIGQFRNYLRDLDIENGFSRSGRSSKMLIQKPVRPAVKTAVPEIPASGNETGKSAKQKTSKFNLTRAEQFEHPASPPDDLLKCE